MSNYNADSIKTLEFKDAIRERVAMYLGDAGMGGVYQAVREIITNSIDEFTMGKGNKIKVSLKGNTITVEDNASGVPFGTRSDGTDAMIAIYTLPHSGGKFDDDVYKNVAGMNGIGGKATALSSSSFMAVSTRGGEQAILTIKEGVVTDFTTKKVNTKTTGTVVAFTPDAKVFHLEPIKVDFNELKEMCETWAYLSPGLVFELENLDTEEKVKYDFKNGIVDLIKAKNKKPLHSQVISKKVEDENGNKVEVAIQWSRERQENAFVFTNGLHNSQGGTSLTGARTSLTRTINNLADIKFSGESIRTGLYYAISASVKNPSFSDQTKTKVNNPELRGLADRAVAEALREFSQTKEWERLVEVLIKEEKAEQAAEKAREKILSTEKELTNAATRRGVDLPDKVADATNKTGYRELYVTEGDSASAYLKSTRDSATQGVMPLRGKILNTYGLELHEAYENEEVKAIFTLLGSGAGNVYNDKKLRYNKIIIATDSDPDGAHISLLLIGLFLEHTPQLIRDGKLYRVIAPFYGVGSGANYKLLYSDNELKEYEQKHGKQKNIDRFKGLGAMNEDLAEKYVMNPQYRKLVQIKMEDLDEMRDLFDTLLGKDLEGRRKLVREGI